MLVNYQCGGPGRTRTCNQTVMSGDTRSEHPLIIGEFIDVRSQSSSFVHAISVVNRWFEIAAQHHDADDRNGHSDQHRRQRPSHSSHRVVALDPNLERPKPDIKRNGPSAGGQVEAVNRWCRYGAARFQYPPALKPFRTSPIWVMTFTSVLWRFALIAGGTKSFHTKTTTDHRIGATGLAFDFRLLQQYRPFSDLSPLRFGFHLPGGPVDILRCA